MILFCQMIKSVIVLIMVMGIYDEADDGDGDRKKEHGWIVNW